MGRRSCEWVRAHVRLNSLHTPGYVDYFLVYLDTAVKIIDNFLAKIWLYPGMTVCMAVCGWLEMAAGRMHMLHLRSYSTLCACCRLTALLLVPALLVRREAHHGLAAGRGPMI